jgi:serine/threonine protein kinase
MMDTVIDTNRNNYTIAKKLGAGSQGTTYLLEDGKHIAKLFNQNFNATETKSKINFLIQLGLDKRYFAVPLREITQPQTGYISEFASGMMPLEELKWKNQSDNLGEWYLQTGGLQKRYNILIKLADVLRKLHSKGLAYCDLSPNNVFISDKPEHSNVFLIDLDNLRYKTSIVNNIWTPFYGAPEVVTSNAPNTPMSDCFSFAVIAYELLTLNHPLIGDYVTDGEPELEDQALQGKLPWVDNEEDTTNERSTGLPTEYVIPKRLLKLFKKTFEKGLNNSMERPSMSEWFEVLNLGLNELLKCGNSECGLHYPYNNLQKCPFCKTKPEKITKIQMRRWEEVEKYDKATNTVKKSFELQEEALDEILLDENTPKEIISLNFLLPDTDILKPLLQVELLNENNDNKVLLRPQNSTVFKLSNRMGTPHTRPNSTTQTLIERPQKIRIADSSHPDKQKYMLHLQDLNTPQRVLTID